MRPRQLVILLAFLTLAAVPQHASAGLIVWQKGDELWVMKDDGSGQARLVDASKAPGADSLASPSLHHAGKTIVFEGAGAAGQNHATGIYRYSSGSVSRISPAPTPCTTRDGTCTSRSEEPEQMGASGRVAFEELRTSGSGLQLSASGDILTMPLAGGDATGFGPACSGAFKRPSDPSANPTKATELAYVGCRNSSSNDQLIVSEANGAGQRVLATTAGGFREPSWRPDGAKVVVAVGGDKPGLRVVDTSLTQVGAYAVYAASHALNMPLESGVEHQPRFMANGKIVFAAQGELWTIPLTCKDCNFPADATKLTTDGAGGAQLDQAPTWTSQTTLYSVSRVPPTYFQDPANPTYDENGDPYVAEDEEGYYDNCPPDAADWCFEYTEEPEEYTWEEWEGGETEYEEYGEYEDYDYAFGDEFDAAEFGETEDLDAPRLRKLALTPKRFRRVTATGGDKKGGTLVTYGISEPATVTFRVQRATGGRQVPIRSEIGGKSGTACAKETRRTRRLKRCRRWVALNGTFQHTAGRTKTGFRFTGWYRGKPLAPGTYRLVAVAADAAGNKSLPVMAAFRIKGR